MFKNYLFLVLMMIAALGFEAFAGGATISGGGHGVEENGQIYLLDLYERNLHKNVIPGVNQYVSDCDSMTDFLNEFKNAQGICNELLKDMGLDLSFEVPLAKQISFIGKRDPILSASLLKAIQKLRWTFTDHKLKFVDPDSVLQISTLQVALRTGSEVYIHKPYWDKMNFSNRIALIVHEALAAIADREVQSQMTVRSLVANLFDLSFYLLPLEIVQKELTFFPSVQKIKGSHSSQILISSKTWYDSKIHASQEWLIGPVVRFQNTIAIKNKSELLSLIKINCKAGTNYFEIGYHTLEVEKDPLLQNGSETPRFNTSLVYRKQAKVSCKNLDIKNELAWFDLFELF